MNAILHLSPKMSKQTSTVGKVLMWMQDNEKQLRNTNCSALGRTIAIALGTNTQSTRMVLQKMVNNQIIYRHGGKRRSTFFINYYHKDIPGYIIERGPQYVKDRIKEMKEKLEKNQHIDEVGCIVTEPEKKTKKRGRKPGRKPTMKPVEEPTKQEQEEPKAIEGETVVAPVEVKEDGKSINITITLNLTINK